MVWVLGLVDLAALAAGARVVPVIGLAFGALGLVVTAVSPSYDFFSYYFTLVVTPMAMLCGVFFPIDRLPAAVQMVRGRAAALACGGARPPADVRRDARRTSVLHVAVLLAYAVAGFYAAIVLFRRRLAS